jgi:hypothetical protein
MPSGKAFKGFACDVVSLALKQAENNENYLAAIVFIP